MEGVVEAVLERHKSLVYKLSRLLSFYNNSLAIAVSKIWYSKQNSGRLLRLKNGAIFTR